jgi:hypothetical protein
MNRWYRRISVARAMGILVAVHLVFVCAMAVSADLHRWLHPEAGQSEHVCAATDLFSGGAGDGTVAPPIAAPELAAPIILRILPADLEWVPPVFAAATPFVRGPPVCS